MTGPRRKGLKKFFSHEALVEAAQQATAAAERQRVDIALVGGLALQLNGSDRLTGDVDFVASRLPKGFPTGRVLSFGGRATKAPNGVPLDWIVRDDKWARLYRDALKHAVWIDELGVPIVTPEYLAAMKMASGRIKDEGDLMFLTEVVDLDETRVVIEKYLGPYAVDDFDRVLDEAKWERSRR